MSCRATVLIPTFNHECLLYQSVGSVLEQTVSDIEVFIVGDGVPDRTREIVAELKQRDDRVYFFDHPKGPRFGEAYRHGVLQHATGEIVCYLSDDDIYMADHVEYMLELLGRADFCNTLCMYIDGDGAINYGPVDMADPSFRRQELEGRGMVSLTMGAHTLDMYRRLPYGWRTTPDNISTDLYMWQQFLAITDCRAASGIKPTAIRFPNIFREHRSLAERFDELENWREKARDLIWRDQQVIDLLIKGVHDLPAHQKVLEETRQQVLRLAQQLGRRENGTGGSGE
ncbi:glycosyltransferase family 2 protein [Pseudomonadota bacterium]